MKLPNIGYHSALREGRMIRQVFRAAAPVLIRRRITPPRTVDLDVFSYSNDSMLAEQIVSIRSFLRYVGRPNQFTVVSDGTHTRRSIGLLQEIDSCVRVREAIAPPPDLPAHFRQYLTDHPTGKQLSLVMSLPHRAPSLYVDSDVRFFAGAAGLPEEIAQLAGPASYLADCQFSGDVRLLASDAERRDPVNTGVLLFVRPLDWSVAAQRYPNGNFTADFFTNQTLTHLVMHQNGAHPFDRKRYVLEVDDQCEFRDRHAGPEIVLRHYVNPVRHKFWTSLLH